MTSIRTRALWLAAGLCLGTACTVTTEADTAAEEQRAYGRCVDGCMSEPSEQAEGMGQENLRLCRQDCASSYPLNDSVASDAKAGSLQGPETGGPDPTGVTADLPPPPPPVPPAASE